MIKSKFTGALVGSVLTLGALFTTQVSADPIEDAIDYRQSVFTAIKWHFGPMGAMIRGKMDYDADRFAHHATQLAALTHMPAEGFIAGSDMGDTKAKSEIWENLDDVSARFDTFIADSAALAEAAAAKGGVDSVKAAFGQVAKSCKGCHDKYKAD